jgi:FkbH-like protein
MDAAEFLFPRDLAATQTKISRVLLVGSCMAEAYLKYFRKIVPDVAFDWVLFNNLAELPDIDAGTLQSYDFQYVQLPLRNIVSDEIVNFSGFLAEGAADAIFSRARQILQLMLDTALKHNKKHNVLTFVANFFVPQVPVVAALDQIGSDTDFSAIVRRLNEELAQLVRGYKNVYLADIDAVGNSIGKRYFLEDVVGFYSHSAYWGPVNDEFDTATHFNAPSTPRIEPLPSMDEVYGCHADQLFRALWRQLECFVRTINQTDMVKLVIFDLDDTMWRGQIAEHYGDGGGWPVLHGWPVGIWETVQHLRARGIIVAICSKNEESLVRERWSRAVPMWIKLDDFPLREINWRPKAENVARIIKSASVTAKSAVFVDDNPVERGAVKAALPEIRVIGSNPHVTRRILLWSPETQLAFRSQESAIREQSIRQLQLRESDRSAMSHEAFLQSLECGVRLKRILTAEDADFARSLELLNKTNQFNTTGIRWTARQIEAFFAMGGEIFSFKVADKYTDYGLVGVVLYREGIFVQVAMSCRVLGLDVETSVVQVLMAHLRQAEGRAEFMARVFPTETNMVCRDLFIRCGFAPRDDNQSVQFRPSGPIPAAAAHLRVEFSAEDAGKKAVA